MDEKSSFDYRSRATVRLSRERAVRLVQRGMLEGECREADGSPALQLCDLG